MEKPVSKDNKIKTFFKKYWKLLVTILILVAVGGIVALVLHLTGVNMNQLRAMLEGVGWWKYPVFVLVQILFDLLLAFFPFTTMGFIALGFVLFPVWVNFLLCACATLGISFIMYGLGRKFGYKIGNKLIGEEEMNKAKHFLNTRGTVYLPVMFLFPFFPDDALCLVAGASKMKFWYFSLCTVVCRPIGILTWCLMFYLFGDVIDVMFIVNTILNVFYTPELGNLIGIVIIVLIVNLLLFDVYIIVKVIRKIADKIDKWFANKNNSVAEKK